MVKLMKLKFQNLSFAHFQGSVPKFCIIFLRGTLELCKV